MIQIKTLLPELRKLVSELAEDLLARASNDVAIDAGMREAFHQIEEGGRTAQAYEVWLEDYLDQVAVAWVLACVFVRFMEDNGLIDECWLAGEGPQRKLVEDTHELFFREHPHDTDREYFQHVFHEVGKIPAAMDLFAEGKTPLWAVAPSGDAAMNLLKFWREMDATTGQLKRSFRVENGDTRFLGDLYQELSERAKKKFALLQTPVFVEEFILDRTLTPALAEFGLDKVRMIDPTCGSGHFLLGGFARLFELWSKPDHTTGNAEKDAQKALDGVWGVDINPFAVAIARFRLIVAAVQACGIKRLKKAPGWNIHLASGDSLLFGSKPSFRGERVGISQQMSLFEVPAIYAVEDRKTLQQILGQGYHVVVGNPPYITVKDRLQNEAYRRLYSTCHRKYSLAAPFAQRFWELAIQKEEGNGVSGYVGQITANSFMKRQFGKKLIEQYLPSLDLTHIIDLTGAYIPGHTTSTVILLGRNRKPDSSVVRAVLGIRGESSVPENPAEAPVWTSIVTLLDQAGTESAYVSVCDLDRSSLARHPWSIGGGGASELKELIEDNSSGVARNEAQVFGGFFGITGADDVFMADRNTFIRRGVGPEWIRRLVIGNDIRDWTFDGEGWVLFPYQNGSLCEELPKELNKWLWTSRTVLGNRPTFEKETYFASGLAWWKWHQIALERLLPLRSIFFPEIATHNHFALDQGGGVANQTAHIIKLHKDASDEAYYRLLGVLNSSVACFWAKQVIPCKGLGGQGGGIKPEPWSRAFVFSATSIGKTPLPAESTEIARLAQTLDEIARKQSGVRPECIVDLSRDDLEGRLSAGRTEYEALQRKLVALQEEIDWKLYALFGLCDETSTTDDVLMSGLDPKERPVEKLLRQRIESGEPSIYYSVHVYRGTKSDGTAPTSTMAAVIQRRLEIIAKNADVRLIEQLDFKRRWQVEPWEKQQAHALRQWLLHRLESRDYWPVTLGPQLQSIAQLADKASGDHEFRQVAEAYRRRPDFDAVVLVAELIEDESVPLLTSLCYKASGLRKRDVWERTWELQRQEDKAGAVGLTPIPVPPEYKAVDFIRSSFWRLRGSLDLPKERWVSYPHCSTDSDPTLVVGWAGWNHLEQATALVAYYDARKREGWDAKRLTPLLAGLDQLLPWIHQWHPEIDPEFGETAGQSFQTMLESDAHELGLTLDDIRAWVPPAKAAGNKPRKTRTSRKKKAEVEGEDD